MSGSNLGSQVLLLHSIVQMELSQLPDLQAGLALSIDPLHHIDFVFLRNRDARLAPDRLHVFELLSSLLVGIKHCIFIGGFAVTISVMLLEFS